ncbi:MAG: DUF6495 family protein [Bacteroidota bacterium]
MKYRRLEPAELADLEQEFVRFLSTSQITVDEWQKLKKEKPDQVDELIDVFSDLVFDRILKGIEYLEFKSQTDLKTFRCEKDKIHLLGLTVQGESDIDFIRNDSPEDMVKQLKSSGAQLKMYQGEKAYKPNREAELFRMLEGGCLISKDGAMYKTLESLKQGS